jgi:hypothetical protein
MSHRWLAVFTVAVAFFVASDYLLYGGKGHGEFWWSHLWGFFAVFGFLSCVAIILVSKALGHYWLQRPEDYYDHGDRDG